MGEPPAGFAGLLRQLRREARLTQEELAEAAGLTARAVSYLERGVVSTPQRETVRLLGDALGLVGPARAGFEAAARGRAAAGGVAAATRTLPRDIASFTGRARELEQLAAAAAGAGGVVGIHAIGGMAGVGKTAFAVHAAHRLAGRFPGGQIFLPLHGHTPGQRPVDPADALASLLLTAGVAPAQIPPGLEARMGLWRDRLAGRQLLLILDDAVGSEQVLPLLPGSGGSLVLVTSRRHLSALEDATAISLDTLPAGEAAGLLVRLAGRPGLGAGDRGVAEIIRLCGFLPLAIGMVARQLRHHPAWTAAGRAAELAAAAGLLELMATENLSVAAAFDLSYAELDADLQQLFRRLGLHPGGEVDGYAAAALDGTGLAAARRGLEALYDRYLLTEPAPGRYRMHDLIREHARVLAGRLDPDRDQATARLLDHYQHAAARAGALIARQTRPSQPATDDAIQAAVPVLAGSEQALAWLRAERASLLACLDHAAATGQHARVIDLTASLAGLLRYDGPWAEAITRHQAAIAAARHLGDRLSQANALSDLGIVRRVTTDFPAADQATEQALAIYRDLGDRLGQANALSNLGAVHLATGEYPAAAQVLDQALGIYRDLGDRLGQANALSDLGEARRLTGDYPAAAQVLDQALGIYRDLGDRLGQAHTLSYLGGMQLETGDYPAAAQAGEQALGIYRDLGNRLGQAHTLRYLGELHLAMGDYPAAAQVLEQALGVYRDLGTRAGQANALLYLGDVHLATGDYPAAARALEQALGVYRDLGDRLGQAIALRDLGIVRRLTGDYPAAVQAEEQALGIFRDLGNRLGQANALRYLGAVHLAMGDYPAAAQVLEQALGVYRDLGHRLGQAGALTYLGTVRRLTGDYPAAARATEQALGIYRDLGDRTGEAEALNERGTLHRVSGDLAQAGECHRQALALARAIVSSWHEAHALAGLGRCALAVGNVTQTAALLRQALEIFQRIGAAEGGDVSRELAALTQAGPPA